MKIIKQIPYPINLFLEELGEIILFIFDDNLKIIESNQFFNKLFADNSSSALEDYLTTTSFETLELPEQDSFNEQIISFKTSTKIEYESSCYIFNLNTKYLVLSKKISIEEGIFNKISLLNNELANKNREMAKKNYKLEEAKEEIRAQNEELEAQNEELEELYNRLDDEFEKASQLQQQFLPTELPEIEGISYDSYFQPSAKLGGDFYDIVILNQQVLFYLADVSGHGLDGSMINIFLRTTVNNYLLYQHQEDTKLSPGELIGYVAAKYRKESFAADYFICLLVGVLDLTKMEFTFANAGFQFPPISISNQGETSSLSCGGMPITSAISKALFIKLGLSKYQEVNLLLEEGSTVFLTTDGLIEEIAAGQNYGEHRLKSVLAKNYKLPTSLINEQIKKDFEDFAATLQAQDDLTFITIKRKLEVIASFNRSINSDIEQMYQLKEELEEFITPYYEITDLICIAFQEMITNAMEHGNQMDPSKEVQIEVEVTKDYLKITISDQGPGHDWQNKINQELDIENNFANDRGRGIKISKKVCDQVWYNKKGNQVHLLKWREEEDC